MPETRKENEFNVVAKILRAAAKGSKEDEMMNLCRLDQLILQNYLTALSELKLVRIDNGNGKLYWTTEKGLQLLRVYHHLKWLLWRKENDFLLMRLLNQVKKKENGPFYIQ